MEFTTDGSFRVDLSNHGEGVHVHLHPDDELSAVAHVENGNVYVAGDTTTTVDVVVDDVPSTPVTGRLEVSSGYGAETTYVDVTVEPGVEPTREVAVDESLSKPQPTRPERSALVGALDGLPGPGTLPYVAFVLLAVVVAVGAVVFFESSPAVLVGAGVVLGGAVAALIFIAK
jgi:hypothetical protein